MRVFAGKMKPRAAYPLVKIFMRLDKFMRWLRSFTCDRYQLSETATLYYISKILKLNSGAVVLESKDIRRAKDTVFVMGSGYSIAGISEQEWSHFRETGDILGFNWFFRGEFIPVTYHVVREMGGFRTVLANKRMFKSYTTELFNNPCYRNTTYFVQCDKKAQATLWCVFFLKMFKNKKVCFYKNLPDGAGIYEPSDDITAIPHCGVSLFDVINVSYILGYKKIVLVGVDLYDRRYFWLRQDETREGEPKRGASYSDIHSTLSRVLKGMPVWREYLSKRGVEIYLYNPRSLLTGILSVYRSK